MTEVWNEVPEEFTFGIDDVWASNIGRIKINGKIIEGYKGPKGNSGFYKTTHLLFFSFEMPMLSLM